MHGIVRYCGLVVLIVASGCNRSPSANPFSAEISDTSGNHRLTLVYVPLNPGPVSNSHVFDFDSLIWRSKVGTNWTNRVVITKAEFNSGASCQRWISEIYSLDPATGNAVIKVAEVSAQRTNGTTRSVTCTYSWREWNLTTNQEIRILRVCKEPFEPFQGKRIKLR